MTRWARRLVRGAVWGLVLAALGGVPACAPPPPPPLAHEPPELVEARRHLAQAQARSRQVVWLCDLARRAAPSAGDLAEEFLRRAWPLAQAAAQDPGRELARGLIQARPGWPEPWRGRAGEVAARLDATGGRVWPLALVAETAMGVTPELAAQALDQAQRRLDDLPAGATRDQDLCRLSLALVGWDAGRARGLAERVDAPLDRAWVWRQLARAGLAEAAERAAQAARSAPDGPQKALALARCGQAALGPDPALALELFGQAWDQALGLDPPQLARRTQGQVAAVVAGAAPLVGLELARRLEPGLARLSALRQAGLGLLSQDLAAGRALLGEAADQLPQVSSTSDRALAAASLAQDLAGLDPVLARDLLEQLPPGADYLRGRVAEVLLPTAASHDPGWARQLAEAIADPGWRALALTRLAAIARQRGEAEARRELAGQALELAQAHAALPALEALARFWADQDPRKGVDIALGIGENVARVRALLGVARVAESHRQAAPAAWALYLAEEALSHFSAQQAIDKIGLLGDMGQEWSARDETQSRRFFQQGAAAAQAAAPGS